MCYTLGKDYNTLLKAIKENLKESFIMSMDSKIHSVNMPFPKNSNLWEKHSIGSIKYWIMV